MGYFENFSENFFLFNLLVEITISMVNVQFSMNIYNDFFELFMVLNLIYFVLMIFKMRLYLTKVEQNILLMYNNEEDINK